MLLESKRNTDLDAFHSRRQGGATYMVPELDSHCGIVYLALLADCYKVHPSFLSEIGIFGATACTRRRISGLLRRGMHSITALAEVPALLVQRHHHARHLRVQYVRASAEERGAAVQVHGAAHLYRPAVPEPARLDARREPVVSRSKFVDCQRCRAQENSADTPTGAAQWRALWTSSCEPGVHAGRQSVLHQHAHRGARRGALQLDCWRMFFF